MIKNDEKRFNEICKSDFIDTIFYSTVLGIESFENAILTLAAINEDSKVSKHFIQQTWELFNARVLQLDNSISKLEIGEWQIFLIKNISDDKYLKQLVEGYFKLIDDDNIENYIDLIDDLIKDIGEERILNQLVKRNISDKNYIQLIEYKGNEFKKYKLSTNYQLLDKHLSKLIISDVLELENTKLFPKEYDFKEYKESLVKNLKTFISQNNPQSADSTLLKIKERSQNNGELKGLLEDDKIYTFFVNNTSSKLPIINEIIAMRISRGSEFHSSYANHFTNVLNTEDDERAGEIANTILNYSKYGDLLLLSNHFKANPLFKQIILKMFAKADLGKVDNVITLIEKYSEIKNNLKIEDNSLLKELNKWGIDKDKFDVNELSDEFIDDCLENPELRISKDFLKVFNTEFKNLDKESYETVFDNGTDIHFKYFRQIELENLTQESLNVFEDKLIEKLISTNVINKQWWNVLEIYESNNSNISIVNTFKNILDKILTAEIDLKVEYTNILLPYFIKYQLLDKQSDIFRLIIKNEFLSNSDFLQLLISNSDSIKTLYAAAIKTDKDNFRNLLNEKREENLEFETLAKVLDIRKSKSKSEED